MKRYVSKLSSIALLASFTTTACTSTPPRRPRGPMQAPIEKEGQKIPGGEIQVSEAPKPAEAPESAKPAVDSQGLWSRINNMAEPMAEDDVLKATQLYPAQNNSLEEAIFVVAQMRILQNEIDKRSSFQTQDLHTNQAADYTAGLSLERTFADLQMDLAAIVASNPHLKNQASLTLAKKILAVTKSSDSYRAGLTAAIKQQGAQWPELLVDEVPSATNPAASATTPAPATTPVPPSPEGTPTAPASNLDLMGSDTLLVTAQKLADKRDYKAALEHVAKIKPEDPFHAQAQEKLKQYSNRAVKELRAKAAEAFSNATPLNDSAMKASYLRQAKLFLEQALNDYPAADGLDTVKENLEAVNRGLEASEKTGT